jgi:hypothetical protein
VEFVGIGLLDSKEKSLGFVQRHSLTFPNGYDGDGRIAKAYGFTYQPWWAVISKDGVLLRTGRGPTSEEELANTVKTLVGR